ncbi:MAG TPA: lysophospholipid acyltransferase family protein [bacterium]|nr:lysophospholipid acyltransferase family protein [bacterium]HQI48682.1 lysophospholipid acyltransferase family protein [bacterium]HQJ65009.1 lysophospholipid acyltransferase family protein [bacterium]
MPLITARHSKTALALFHLYLLPAMQRQFHAVYLLGNEPAWPAHTPLIILPNHSSWWDGFFVDLLNIRLWQRQLYVMMLEEQLRKRLFFRRLGVFSIDPATPGGVRSSLRYTRELLQGEAAGRRVLCFFPQGELLPWQTRPLGYKPGLIWLLQHLEGPVCLVQLGIRIEFLQQQRPEVFLEFSRPLQWSGRPELLAEWEEGHAVLLDGLSRRIAAREEGRILLQGRHSVDARWQHWRGLLWRNAR